MTRSTRATAGLALLALLVAPTLLAPVASAEWTMVHGFSWRDARHILDWDLAADGTLRFATAHEDEYLLYERGPPGNVTATFVRPLKDLHRVAVVNVDGEWGLLHQDRVPNPAPVSGPPLVFDVPVDAERMRSRVLNPHPVPWDQFQQGADGRLHFLRVHPDGVVNVTTFDPRGAPAWRYHETGLRGHGVDVRLRSDGSVVGARWTTDGAFVMTWNAERGVREEKVSPYWDYQDARVAWTTNGTLAVLFAERRDTCDLFVKDSADAWHSREIPECPLAIHDQGIITLRFLEDGTLKAFTRKGFWTESPRFERPGCVESPGGWVRHPDGSEFLVSGGRSVWTRAPAPEVQIVADPPLDAPTGMGVRFTLEGNLTGLTDPEVVWHFGDGGARGTEVTHVFFEPAAYTVRAVVESGGASCRERAAVATLTYEATGVSRTPSPPEAGDEEGDLADPAAIASRNATEAANESGLPVPGPGVLAAFAALAAVAVRRRRRA